MIRSVWYRSNSRKNFLDREDYTAQIRQHELRSHRSGLYLPWKIYMMEVGTDYLPEVVILLYLLAPWIKPGGQKNRQQKFHKKRPQLTLGYVYIVPLVPTPFTRPESGISHIVLIRVSNHSPTPFYPTIRIGNQSYRVN